MTKKKSSKKEPVDPLPEAEMEGEAPTVIETVVDEEQVLFTEPDMVAEYGEVEDMLIVCAQCGRAVRVPPLEKLPESCACGIKYDYNNQVPESTVVIDEPTTLVVRKVPMKFVR